VFVPTYAELCRDLRRHLRLRLNLNLNLHLYLCLYLYLNLSPNLFLFQKPFEKPKALSFASKPDSLLGLNLNLNLNLFLLRLPPPRQSPVCHPHGIIVVPAMPNRYI